MSKKRGSDRAIPWLLALLFVVVVFSTVRCDPSEDKPPHVPTHKEKIESQFSAWDGSHRQLERFIKKNMRDPSSYEHIETRYGDKGTHLIVVTKFRGRNGFGGMTVETVVAKVGLDGKIIKVIGWE